ncbi:hypothetical protein ET475_07530 [Microbacterium protaetiae]|uniref:Htaa domain-containing protein n=1 Tax=Microbacterium protaetiae TaxID=2509458 RepID=A0A4P6ECQ8_9MICO|nr:HtaA domain-containing protein [Microbacterium protaetiae]QAY59854.1 hypothetical protein ET475_07530 [Microbacterium protaetiae]
MRHHHPNRWRRAAAGLAALALAAAGLAVTAPAYAADAPARQTTVDVTAASQADGLKLHVTGAGYTDLPPAVGGPTAGIYVALRDVTVSDDDVQTEAVVTAYVPVIVGGAWTADLQTSVDTLAADASYEVIVWVAHGYVTDASKLATQPVALTDAQHEALFPTPKPQPVTTVAVSSADAEGLKLHVTGSGYTDLPKASTGKDNAGVYVALRDVTMTDEQLNADTTAAPAVNYIWSGSITDGAWSTDVVAPVAKLDATASYEVIVWVAHGTITADTLLDAKAVELTDAQHEALFPATDPGTNPGETDPGETDPGETDPGQTDPGQSWKTTVAVSSADADGLKLHVTGSGYTDLPKASTGKDNAGVYVALRDVTMTDEQLNADTTAAPAVNYIWSGSITDGAWATDLVAPVAKLDATASYEVIVWVAHGTITADTLLDAKAVELTDAQRKALSSATDPGETDPGETDPGTTDPGATDPGTTEPGTTGPKAAISGGSTVKTGGKLVVSATGFAAGERVSAAVHSDPVSLGSKTASATGAVSFTWTVPAGFATGAHEVVLTAASGTVRVPFTVAAASGSKTLTPTAQVTCTTQTVPATAGTPHLSWGVKSSFVSYIGGGIANGSVTASNGAARSGSTFTWGSGTDTLASSGQGTVSFPGSVHFTGHDGALETTLSNPRVQITGARTGVLVLAVNSKTLEGGTVSNSSITFANLQFSSASATGGTASVTLTAAGAEAFAGFYSAGESFDALTVSFSGARAATTQKVCYDADGNRVNADGSAYVGPSLTASGFAVNTGGAPVAEAGAGQWGWIPLVAGLLLLTVVIRRATAARR